MREFKEIQDSFEINGRGICFSGSDFKLRPGEWEPWDITGETVLLNGVEVRVTGVDAFACHRSPSSPYPHTFAVMVSKEDAEKVNWKLPASA